MKLAISLLTCDKPELVEQSIKPLLAGALDNKFHLFVVDGSDNPENEKAIWTLSYPSAHMTANVRGGAGAAIVYALTEMLKHPEGYTHVGLVESDVLLLDDWLDSLDLFDKGAADGLEVGAASARCYVDRVLFQRNNYAVMHNIGAGCILLTRQAAEIILDTFRTPWTSDNRRIFSKLCGVDIASIWCFRANEHYLTADWGWDATLAAHGLSSLALTPSPCDMIGQNMPLAEQGLTIATSPIEDRRDDSAFNLFRTALGLIDCRAKNLGTETKFHFDPNSGTWTYFPHQMHMLGGVYSGDWKLKEVRGFGTFGWVAGDEYQHTQVGFVNGEGIVSERGKSSLTVPAFGSVSLLVSGGKDGGRIEVVDEGSGFKASPDMPPEGDAVSVLHMQIPGGLNYRNIRITALTLGVVFYGMQSREQQPFLPNVKFDYSVLPPA